MACVYLILAVCSKSKVLIAQMGLYSASTRKKDVPAGANGKASHHPSGPSHPCGRKNTGCFLYHHPTPNCNPVVKNHNSVLNFMAKANLEDATSAST